MTSDNELSELSLPRNGHFGRASFAACSLIIELRAAFRAPPRLPLQNQLRSRPWLHINSARYLRFANR